MRVQLAAGLQGQRRTLWIPKPCSKPDPGVLLWPHQLTTPGSALFQPHVPLRGSLDLSLWQSSSFRTGPRLSNTATATLARTSFTLHPESLPLIPLLFPFLLSQTPFPPSTPIFSLLPPLTEALFSYLSHKTLFTCHLLQEVSHVPSGKKGPLSLLSLRFYVVTLCQAPKGAQARCQFITIY